MDAYLKDPWLYVWGMALGLVGALVAVWLLPWLVVRGIHRWLGRGD